MNRANHEPHARYARGPGTDFTFDAEAAAGLFAVHVSQMGSVLEPIGDPEAPDGYIPRTGPAYYAPRAHHEWSCIEYPGHAHVLLASLPGESESARAARITAEVRRLSALPYITGCYDPNDREWGYLHTWLSDGTVVKFWPQATPPCDWRWEAGGAAGVAPNIEAGRIDAAAALGVAAEMSPEAFGALFDNFRSTAEAFTRQRHGGAS